MSAARSAWIEMKKAKGLYDAPRPMHLRSLRSTRVGYCTFCEIKCGDGLALRLTRHHLIPLSIDNSPDNRRNWVDACDDCHRFIHATWTNDYLGAHLNTAEAILETPEMGTYLEELRTGVVQQCEVRLTVPVAEYLQAA